MDAWAWWHQAHSPRMEAGGLEFFLKKYIDGAVVATSNSMIILPLENQWDQFQRYFHLKYHRIILTLKHVRNIVEIQKTAPSSLSCLVSLYIYIGDIVAT